MPYFSNDLVLERVADGTAGAGLVWETALTFATDGNPSEAGYHVLEGLPFQVPSIEIGIATRTEDRYLNEILSGAINALLADGSIERLMREHHLLPVDAD
jgi:polar amino acid transport system substrate-binding protein